ncbi:MAG: 4'-phosphopantetheinyl transferase superfamily protein [Bacteroidetes bacterium]|nr:4'-phosphopantetheinyl transferase superfamily protein [Bacteroidota bacterium]
MGEPRFIKGDHIKEDLVEKLKEIFQSLIRFSSGNDELAAGLVLCPSLSNEELNVRTRMLLHQEEINTGGGYTSDIRRRSFLNGRIAGKMAINTVFPDIPSATCRIITGSIGKPVIGDLPRPYGISIAHNESWNAGLCFPLSVPMGIDVETITEKNRTIIASILSSREKDLCSSEGDPLELTHLLWTAKEAAGKAIGLGFRVPTAWYEIDFVETLKTEPQRIHQCRFKNLLVFTALSVETPGGMLSIAFPAENNLSQTMIRLLQLT